MNLPRVVNINFKKIPLFGLHFPGFYCALFRRSFSERYKKPKYDPNDDIPELFRGIFPLKAFSVDFLATLQKKYDWSWKGIKSWHKERSLEVMKYNQRFIPKRHRILGSDLATAHFIAHREGKVKFEGNDKWITKEHAGTEELPSSFVPNLYLEAVDASNTELCYEGFDNLIHLYHLKELHLRNCPYIDDWCLDRMHQFSFILEHLDISGCSLVTERGLCVLHRLRNLKTLVINDTPNIANKELVCLLLQEVLPECKIIGVDYENEDLLNRLKEYL